MSKPISVELFEITYLMMDRHDRARVRKIAKEVEKLENENEKLKAKLKNKNGA